MLKIKDNVAHAGLSQQLVQLNHYLEFRVEHGKTSQNNNWLTVNLFLTDVMVDGLIKLYGGQLTMVFKQQMPIPMLHTDKDVNMVGDLTDQVVDILLLLVTCIVPFPTTQSQF